MPLLRPAVVALALMFASVASATPAERLEAEIVRIATPVNGDVGVAAWRLDRDGSRVSVNADQLFPMASTFKVADAGAVLAEVDRGKLSLDRMVTIDPAMHVSSDIIASRFIHPGVSLSVRNLIELTMTESDNTATDVLTKLVGGPSAVTAWVRAQGIEGLRVDRDTAGILRDFFGLPAGPFSTALEAGLKADPRIETRGTLPNPVFDNDPRDTATPDAMALLLDRIFTGKALTAASTTLLTETMARNRTGGKRIKGRLPKGVAVADKTGTVGGSINDIGVITLPNGGGQVVIAAFLKKSSAPVAVREEAIADIARAVYDYYLFGEPSRQYCSLSACSLPTGSGWWR